MDSLIKLLITPETPALRPPPGVVPNFSDPDSHDKEIIALHTICLTFTTLFIVMRIYTRYFISHWLSWDDYVCLFAYAMNVVFSGILLKARQLGFGRHLWDIRAIDAVKVIKMLFVMANLYLPLVAVIKLAFLLFFDRVFSPSPKLKLLTRGGMIVISIVYVVFLFRSIFYCTPVQKAYNPAIPGHCIKLTVLPYGTGIFNIISDFYILLLPLPFIWSLKMELKRKLRLVAVFSVGLFVCATSIARLVATVSSFSDPDATWNLTTTSLWTVLEVNIGIICACSLALPAFLDRYWPRSLSSKISQAYSYLTSFSIAITRRDSSRDNQYSGCECGGKDTSGRQRLGSSNSQYFNDKSSGLAGSFKANCSHSDPSDEADSALSMVRLGEERVHRQTWVHSNSGRELDVEKWPGTGSQHEGIMKTVNFEQRTVHP